MSLGAHDQCVFARGPASSYPQAVWSLDASHRFAEVGASLVLLPEASEMTTQHTGDEHRHTALDEIVALLDHAYEQTCASSQPDPPRMDLGLGIYLLRAQACHTLHSGRSAALVDRSDPTSVPTLLRTAERLTRDLPIGTDALPNVADLVVVLCDLIRDADRVTW